MHPNRGLVHLPRTSDMCSFPTKRHVEVELRSPREPPIHKPMPFPHLLPEIRLSVPLEGFLVRLLHPPEMRSSLPFSIFPALRRARLLNRKYSCFVPTLALSCLPYSSSTFCMAATAHTFTVASVPPPASHSPLGDQARACASFCPLSASHTSTRLGRTLTIARRSPSGDQASVPPLIS